MRAAQLMLVQLDAIIYHGVPTRHDQKIMNIRTRRICCCATVTLPYISETRKYVHLDFAVSKDYMIQSQLVQIFSYTCRLLFLLLFLLIRFCGCFFLYLLYHLPSNLTFLTHTTFLIKYKISQHQHLNVWCKFETFSLLDYYKLVAKQLILVSRFIRGFLCH